MFDPIMNSIHDPKKGSAPGWKRVLAGSLCGVMGAVSCNPFELVKTRFKSASSNTFTLDCKVLPQGKWRWDISMVIPEYFLPSIQYIPKKEYEGYIEEASYPWAGPSWVQVRTCLPSPS
jgi:hypothetical protein